MVAYTKPQERKKEESEQLRGERDKIKFIDLRFERWNIYDIYSIYHNYPLFRETPFAPNSDLSSF